MMEMVAAELHDVLENVRVAKAKSLVRKVGDVGAYERHMLTTMLLRPRRLSSTARKHCILFNAAKSRSRGHV